MNSILVIINYLNNIVFIISFFLIKGLSKKKRSISQYKKEMFVETLIVADKTMVEKFRNDDLENYLLTIMNMVLIYF